MALRKSEFLSACGKAFQIFKALVDAILELGGNDEDVARLESLASEIAKLSIAARPVQEPAEEAQTPAPKAEVEELGWIELDPAIPFDRRVSRGNYIGGVHSNITAKKSRLARKVRRFIVLYDPKGDVSTKEMRRRIKKNGDRPCDLDDGLGIGEKFPQRQIANPLPLLNQSAVCLGYLGYLCAPVLRRWLGERELGLDPLAGYWRGDVRFPAVREEEYLDA